MGRRLDLTGHRYGRLIALSLSPQRTSEGKARWICRCDCGQETTVDARNLRSGSITSCGCWRRERMGELTLRHHMSDTPEYQTWANMRDRCRNSRHRQYADYGGRGITVCPEWNLFERFLSDMGRRPSAKHSLDRIDNDGPYAPWNCRWATMGQQSRNKRSTTLLTCDGRTMPLADWAARIGITVEALCARFRYGWSVERALTTRVAPRRPRARPSR